MKTTGFMKSMMLVGMLSMSTVMMGNTTRKSDVGRMESRTEMRMDKGMEVHHDRHCLDEMHSRHHDKNCHCECHKMNHKVKNDGRRGDKGMDKVVMGGSVTCGRR